MSHTHQHRMFTLLELINEAARGIITTHVHEDTLAAWEHGGGLPIGAIFTTTMPGNPSEHLGYGVWEPFDQHPTPPPNPHNPHTTYSWERIL